MITYGNKQLKSIMYGSNKVTAVYKGDKKIFPVNEQKFISVMDAVAGDIVVAHNKTGIKRIISQNEDLNLYKDDYTPIGIVVVPGSHDVYGDYSCGVISLKEMSCDTPSTGDTSEQPMHWGEYDINISTLHNLNQVPTGNTIDGIPTGQTSYAYLPSDKFSSTQCAHDTDVYYYDSSLEPIPSPYLTDGSRNPGYYQTSSPSSSSNALADFDGAGNTEKIIAERGTKDYSSWTPTNDSESDYPAASCCDMFYTEGTSQGNWYLPACGELGYIMPSFNKINDVIGKIRTAYGSSVGVELDTNQSYWASTECSSKYTRGVYIFNGYISEYGKNGNCYTRAFLRLYDNSFNFYASSTNVQCSNSNNATITVTSNVDYNETLTELDYNIISMPNGMGVSKDGNTITISRGSCNIGKYQVKLQQAYSDKIIIINVNVIADNYTFCTNIGNTIVDINAQVGSSRYAVDIRSYSQNNGEQMEYIEPTYTIMSSGNWFGISFTKLDYKTVTVHFTITANYSVDGREATVFLTQPESNKTVIIRIIQDSSYGVKPEDLSDDVGIYIQTKVSGRVMSTTEFDSAGGNYLTDVNGIVAVFADDENKIYKKVIAPYIWQGKVDTSWFSHGSNGMGNGVMNTLKALPHSLYNPEINVAYLSLPSMYTYRYSYDNGYGYIPEINELFFCLSQDGVTLINLLQTVSGLNFTSLTNSTTECFISGSATFEGYAFGMKYDTTDNSIESEAHQQQDGVFNLLLFKDLEEDENYYITGWVDTEYNTKNDSVNVILTDTATGASRFFINVLDNSVEVKEYENRVAPVISSFQFTSTNLGEYTPTVTVYDRSRKFFTAYNNTDSLQSQELITQLNELDFQEHKQLLVTVTWTYIIVKN